eukprot:scaffold24335_cov65-Phaeocystis_antarctica.AAC.2
MDERLRGSAEAPRLQCQQVAEPHQLHGSRAGHGGHQCVRVGRPRQTGCQDELRTWVLAALLRQFQRRWCARAGLRMQVSSGTQQRTGALDRDDGRMVKGRAPVGALLEPPFHVVGAGSACSEVGVWGAPVTHAITSGVHPAMTPVCTGKPFSRGAPASRSACASGTPAKPSSSPFAEQLCRAVRDSSPRTVKFAGSAPHLSSMNALSLEPSWQAITKEASIMSLSIPGALQIGSTSAA